MKAQTSLLRKALRYLGALGVVRRWKPVLPGRLALAIIAALMLFMVTQRPFPTANAQTFNPTFTVTLSDYGNLKPADITTHSTFSGADASIWRNSELWSDYAVWPRLEVVAHGADIPLGAKVGTYHDQLTLGLVNNQCNTNVIVDFDLLNATTDVAGPTVSHLGGQADANANNLPDGVDKYPQTLLNRFSWKPRLRLYGQTLVAGSYWVINVAVFDSTVTGYLDSMVFTFMDPVDPATPAPSAITDYCNPTDRTMVNFGTSLDNPNTGANEAGYSVLHNPYLAGTYYYPPNLIAFPDADNDGVDNSLDTCPLIPNAGTDADLDGLDAACDPNDASTNSDQDGDGYSNRQDNCPLVANPTQADGDTDGIGTACDPNDADYGTIMNGSPSYSGYTETITGSADTDGDGWDDNTETYLGTDTGITPSTPAIGKCAATSALNDEVPPDRWPPDFNDNRVENAPDVLTVGLDEFNGTFAPRDDLYPDGTLDAHDLAAFKAAFGQSCTGTPTAPPTPVDGSAYQYGIDTDSTGNDARLTTDFANGLQHCRTVSGIGTTFDVDLYVNAPSPDNPLAGYQYNLSYNPSIIQLQSVNENQLLVQATGSSSPVQADATTPDASGNWTSRVVDTGTPGLEPGGADETGQGVLARLTFKTIADGESWMYPWNVQLVTSTNGTAPSSSAWQQQTLIEVDQSCPPNPVITVNDAGTADDMAQGDGLCYTATYVCTLTAAIEEANANLGADTIHFNIPGGGVHTITASFGEPAIEEPLTIDATTQPGYSGSPLVEVTPGGVCEGPPCGTGFEVDVGASPSAIKGLNIHGYNQGIIDYAGTTIQGNWIGTDSTGNAADGNAIGVYLSGPDNLVGGAGPGEGNIISGNTGDGIYDNAGSNTILGNTIGRAVNGSALGNGSNGINLDLASGDTIGGTSAGEGNVISANGGAGVYVYSSCTDGCVYAVFDSIRGNSIYANADAGIALVGGSNNSMASPAVTGATYAAGKTTVTGTLTTGSPQDAKVDVYSAKAGDPEGRFWMGTAKPDTFGSWTLVYGGAPPYGTFTATATDLSGDTSEFSAAFAPPVGPRSPLSLIVKQSDVTPVGGTFATFGPAAVPNTGGDVVFWASILGGGSSEGIFLAHQGPLPVPPCTPPAGVYCVTKLVSTGDPSPIGPFVAFDQAPGPNASGDVVFSAASATGQGIFKLHLGVVTAIAVTGMPSPAGPVYTGFTIPIGPLTTPTMDDQGDITFFASIGGGEGIFLYKASTGTVVKVAAAGDIAPAGGPFLAFSSPGALASIPTVRNSDSLTATHPQVAFWGAPAAWPTGAIFLWDNGTLTKIAAPGDLAPGGGGAIFTGLSKSAPLNTDGQVAFTATLSSGPVNCIALFAPVVPCGLYVESPSGTTKIFQSGDSGPAGVAGQIDGISLVSLNSSGQISMTLNITDGFTTQAIVRYTDGILDNVAAIGNPGPLAAGDPPGATIGGTFSSFDFAPTFSTVPLISDAGQIVLWGTIVGGTGTTGLFITPTPAPGTSVVNVGPTSGETAPGTGGGVFGDSFDLGVNTDGDAIYQANVVNSPTTTQGVFLFFAGNSVAVAQQGQSIPTTTDQFSAFTSPVVNSSSNVVARASLKNAAGDPVGDGVYLFFAGNASPLQVKARTGVTDGFVSTYSSFMNPAINDSNHVAIQAGLNSEANQGLYLFFAGSTAVKHEVTGVADTSGHTFSAFGRPSLNNSDAVAAKATQGGNSGLYLFFAGSAASQQLATVGQDDGTGTAHSFLSFDDPVIDDSGAVVAKATTTGNGQGLYLFFAGSPTPVKLANLATTNPPSGFGNSFLDLGDPVVADGSTLTNTTVAAWGRTNTTEGLFLFFAGNAYKLAAQGEQSSDGAATFATAGVGGHVSPIFQNVAISNSNSNVKIEFTAQTTTGAGVFSASLDREGDGIPDSRDNCPAHANSGQDNQDIDEKNAGVIHVISDDKGDACDADQDGDGANNCISLPNLIDCTTESPTPLFAEPNGCILTPDCDGDGGGNQAPQSLMDGHDNCPTWANPAQTLPSWWVAAGSMSPAQDWDCDGFPNAVVAGKRTETSIGTDPTKHCNNDTIQNNEADAWPPDLDDNQKSGPQDVLKFSVPVYGSHAVPPDPHYSTRFDWDGNGAIGPTDVLKIIPFYGRFCT